MLCRKRQIKKKAIDIPSPTGHAPDKYNHMVNATAMSITTNILNNILIKAHLTETLSNRNQTSHLQKEQ